MNLNVIVIWAAALMLSVGVLDIPAAVQSQGLWVQGSAMKAQADESDAELKRMPQLQAQIVAYKTKFAALLKDSTVNTAAVALVQATSEVSRRYGVRVTSTTLQGPLLRSEFQSIKVGPQMTPPPTPPPVAGQPNRPRGLSVAATPAPGFFAAVDASHDVVAQTLSAWAGSFTITGSYANDLAALVDLPRHGAFVRVVTSGLCRDDRYNGPIRSLSVVFRLYGLPRDMMGM